MIGFPLLDYMNTSEILNFKARGYFCFFKAQLLFLLLTSVMLAGSISPAYGNSQLPTTLASSKYRFKTINHEQLDSIGALWAIVQDKQGFMWFGGENGLARFDGYDVTIYRHEVSNQSSLSSSYIRDLLVDAQGQLWVATNFGLNKYQSESNSFVRYIHDPEDSLSISGNDIRCLEEGTYGALWLGTGESGLMRFDASSEHFERFDHDPSNPNSIAGNSIYALVKDASGFLWVGTSTNGLDRLKLEKVSASYSSAKFTHFKHDPSESKSLSSNLIRSVYQDKFSNIWVGTINGLNLLEKGTSSFTHYFHQEDNLLSLSFNFVQNMAEDNEGNLWVSTSGGGLNLYDRQQSHFYRYQHDPSNPSSLLNNNIRTLFLDRDGNFWLGHFAAGVSMQDRYATAFKNYYHNAYRSDTLNHNEIVAIAESPEGNLWVGTPKGLNYLDRASDTVRRFTHNSQDAGSINYGGVLGMLIDSKQRLWVGLWGGGLNRLDPQVDEFKHYSANANDKNSLKSDSVWAIFEDSSGRIWVGGHYGGLHYYVESDDNFIGVPKKETEGRGINCDSVFTIYEDRKNNLWVGCSNGLHLRRKGSLDFRHFYHVEGDPSSLSANHVWVISEDSQGALWVGTQGGGANRFDRETNSFRAYRVEDGLADNLVTGILYDNIGYIWFSTGKGLSRFDTTSEIFKNYDTHYGLPGNVFNRAAFLKTKYNELAFGSKDGLSILNPKLILDNDLAPDVRITHFQLFNKNVEIGAKNSPLKKPIVETDQLSLDYSQSSFSFQFAALNYRIPIENQYAYRLDGFDTDWNYIGARRWALYTNLDPGEYVFRVKASNNEGVWNTEGVSIKIIISPPWWHTWWAYILYLLCAALIVMIFIYIIWQRKLADNERRINEQLRAMDKVKDTFLANTSHELRTPLNGMIGLAESIRDGATGEITGESRHYLNMIILSGRRLAHLINDILDFSKLRESKISLQRVPVDLYSLTQVVLTLFQPLLKGRTIDLKNNVTEKLPLILADENRLQQILYNLIGNAVKFTDEGSIVVSTSIYDGFIRVEIKDTGIGISEEQYGKVFDSFEQLDGVDGHDSLGTGLGLAVTKQLVELHGGEIRLYSVLGEGSCFSFTLPIIKPDAQPLVWPLETYENDNLKFEQGSHLFTPKDSHFGYLSFTEGAAKGDLYHILIVDDEPVNRLVLEGFLKIKNYQITECASGQQALDILLKDNDISLVLLDVMMPRLSGLDTCKRLRERYTARELPIIFLTGKNQRADLEAAYAVGGNDFIAKPVGKEELLRRVETHLKLTETKR